ncbi:sugar transferase [Flavimobilis marinus]|nr:sugar transferase [Flavimobilis marinus]
MDRSLDATLTGGQRPWSGMRGYLVRVGVSDVVAIATSVYLAYFIRVDSEGVTSVSGEFSPSYAAVAIALAAGWVLTLWSRRALDRRVVGIGPQEYHKVWSATWRVFASVAVGAYLFKLEIGRGFLAIAFPVGLVLLLVERFLWRQWLHGQRADGHFQARVLVVGHRGKVVAMVDELRSNPNPGFGVIGACIPAAEVSGDEIDGVPILGTFDDIAATAEQWQVDVVSVIGSDHMTGEKIRQLGWDLEGSGRDLAITMPLRDIAGPRLVTSPVNGLPLTYVDEPRFSGPKYAAKSTVDWLVALAITIAISPLLLAIAILVKLSGPGPVFYVQHRIGRGGKPFAMIKFRSMVADAHERLEEALAAEGVEEMTLFYKPKNDMRVTRVGRVLRKYSLDELPQLFNVLRGEMSLVGPRPQIDQEVALYDRRAFRRLLVKPGLTGLWQVSGRSTLTPEQSVRMDVQYAENWTPFGDFVILLRTVRVVLFGEGAY